MAIENPADNAACTKEEWGRCEGLKQPDREVICPSRTSGIGL